MKDVVKHNWIMRMSESMQRLHPDISKERIEKIVSKIYEKRVKDTKVELFNNYENIVAGTSLLGVVDWFHSANPLIAEAGVYFYQKDKKRNINVEIIKEDMLDARTEHKKEKFEAMEFGDVFLASVKDLQQANDKKAANSGYGAEGQSSSFLYNIHSAMSVTSCGRGQISTACQCFENLFADNVKFFDMTEFFTWVYNIVHEQPDWQFETFDIVGHVPDEDAFVEHFKNKFLRPYMYNEEMIHRVYESLDDEMRIRVYYKANLIEFLKNRIPLDLYSDIACMNVEYIDPNKPPEEIKPLLKALTAMVVEFVNYKHGVFRYEDRTRYQKRAVCSVIDTDSNFLHYGPVLRNLEEILPIILFKNKHEAENYKLRVLNVLSDISTKAITERLWEYTGTVNIPEEDRQYIKMKNEFYYSRIIITFAKKSYIGLQKRQEGVVFKTPELDVKGVNFFKSTASEKTSKFIYDKVLMDQLLLPKNGKISLRDTYKTIHDFQVRMTKEIKEGDMGYLKRSIRVKTPDAYANPMRIGQSKAVYVWNQVVPDKDRIDLPATVTLVKVKLQDKRDLAALENWPKIYDRFVKLFDTNPEIGEWTDKDGKVQKAKGIKAIALPGELDEVPDWVLAIIDVDTLVSDNMALFTQLQKPLGFTAGKTGNNNKYYTNIIRI